MADAYVAVARLRWGDGYIEPGEPVPIEPGRDYDGMLRHGLIAKVTAAGPSEGDAAATAKLKSDLKTAVARADAAEKAALAAVEAALDAADGDGEVEIPDGVVPGETPGWPLGVFVVPLTDEQRAELADAGISGTLTHEDLVDLLTPPDTSKDADKTDALPEGVTETSPGWFLLADGTTKVHGRKALTEAFGK